MARRTRIPDSVRHRIVEAYLSLRKDGKAATALEVQQVVEAELRGKNPASPAGWPGVSAVDKILRPIRPKVDALARDPEDRPWTLLAMPFCGIPPEAVPAVVKAWGFCLAFDQVLTIREARWVGRLYRFYGDEIATEGRSLIDDARRLADAERRLAIDGTYPEDASAAFWYWAQDARYYADMTSDASIFIDIVRVASSAASSEDRGRIQEAIGLMLADAKRRARTTDEAGRGRRGDEGKHSAEDQGQER